MAKETKQKRDSILRNFVSPGSEFVKVDNDQRFNFMLQQMQGNRWKITLIVLLTFFFIIFGIVLSVIFKASIQESWKELLLILLGAFVGSFNKVIDFWFSNEDQDKMLVNKMDEEDDDPAILKMKIAKGANSYTADNRRDDDDEEGDSYSYTPVSPVGPVAPAASQPETAAKNDVQYAEMNSDDDDADEDFIPMSERTLDDEEEMEG
jgi:hypothetical protein